MCLRLVIIPVNELKRYASRRLKSIQHRLDSRARFVLSTLLFDAYYALLNLFTGLSIIIYSIAGIFIFFGDAIP